MLVGALRWLLHIVKGRSAGSYVGNEAWTVGKDAKASRQHADE
jgi:hypothetical protein